MTNVVPCYRVSLESISKCSKCGLHHHKIKNKKGLFGGLLIVVYYKYDEPLSSQYKNMKALNYSFGFWSMSNLNLNLKMKKKRK